MQHVNTESVENYLSNIDQKNQFEMIIQNIEESLVIFEDNRMELVNQQFLKHFKNIIIDFENELQSQKGDQSINGENKLLERARTMIK
jgi:molecular chaperone DnaK (HSP70)